MAVSEQIPEFILLTGFLGSGKTTLLGAALSSPEFANTGVIVNDVGEINIDGAIIKAEAGDIATVTLSNGCVCCSVSSNLPMTVAALMDEAERQGRKPFGRIVLEASGLARPAPVIRSLLGLPVPFRIRVVCTYDSSSGALGQDQFEEAASQVAGAQTIVLTKLDKAEDVAVREAETAIASVNPLARLIKEYDETARYRAAFASDSSNISLARSAALRFQSEPKQRRVKTFLARFGEEPSFDDVLDWLENLSGFCGERLLRVKGIISPAGSKDAILFQSVGTVFDPPRMLKRPADAANTLVIIARDLSATEIEKVPGSSTVGITESRGLSDVPPFGL